MKDGERYFDWHELNEPVAGPVGLPDSRTRLLVALVGFVLLVVVIHARLLGLEWASGERYREVAARPLVHRHDLPGVRGRILASDGTVLAHDEMVAAVSVHYRFLEEPPDERWLRRTARARLPTGERGDRRRLAAAEALFQVERAEMHRRLASLCSLTLEAWDIRRAKVQRRVEKISRLVNARRQDQYHSAQAQVAASTLVDGAPEKSDRWWQRVQNAVIETLLAPHQEPPPPSITVAEELEYHVITADLDLEVVAEIEEHPDRYPGVRITHLPRRGYPAGELAAHLIGHLGVVDLEEAITESYHAGALIGRVGIERQYDRLLRGTRGTRIELSNHRGKRLSSHVESEPSAGRDVILTVDMQLQRTAEALLRSALTRRPPRSLGGSATASGGAIVVMDVRTGALLAAASAPVFDPNAFSRADVAEVTKLFADAGGPMFDRVARMALPPGSVFKPLTAIALLESGEIDPREPYFCRGYLHQKDRWRCQIYQRYGQGHGSIGLVDALAYSCNVYFFHHGSQLGPDPLVDWAGRFGFGEPTGIDLPGESGGFLPAPKKVPPRSEHAWHVGDSRALAIGQGALTATPLQIARLMAAIANGGYLVTPHVVRGLGLSAHRSDEVLAETLSRPTGVSRPVDRHSGASELAGGALQDEIEITPPKRIEGLQAETLKTIRRGLERVVSAPEGTAHATVFLDDIAIAGKTGTAESGEDREDHAWFAGYAPAANPKVAFVVVLEHAGGGGTQAGPVAQRLVRRMQQLRYFGGRRTRPPVVQADFETTIPK